MFRITTHKKGDLTVVILDGRLADSDVEEIRRVLSSVEKPAELSLRGLEICDESAVEELRHWIAEGFTIQGASPFIRMLLAKKTDKQGYTLRNME